MSSLIKRYDREGSYRWKLRRRRLVPLLKMINAYHQLYGQVSIIDLGGTESYWNILPASYLTEHGVSITLVNVTSSVLQDRKGIFRHFSGDACELNQFNDNAFHIVHSNSVVEHVGDWARMNQFASEVKRLGESYFVQTPNYWFPIEPHCMTAFFHWLPKPLRVAMVQHFKLGHWPKAHSVSEAVRLVESARLIDRSMFECLFDDAEIVRERALGLTKSFVAIRH